MREKERVKHTPKKPPKPVIQKPFHPTRSSIEDFDEEKGQNIKSTKFKEDSKESPDEEPDDQKHVTWNDIMGRGPSPTKPKLK